MTRTQKGQNKKKPLKIMERCACNLQDTEALEKNQKLG